MSSLTNENKALEDTPNAADCAIDEPTDGPFMRIPAEVRDRIYEYLLLCDESVELDTEHTGEEFYYITRMGKFPQICRTAKKIACECFRLLYGKNSFRFTPETYYPAVYGYLGLGLYSEYIKTIVIDVFTPAHTFLLDGRTVKRGPKIVSYTCCGGDESTSTMNPRDFKNLKELSLNLPQGVDVIEEREVGAVLSYKQAVPEHVAVKFCGATPRIILQLTAAWRNFEETLLMRCERRTPIAISN